MTDKQKKKQVFLLSAWSYTQVTNTIHCRHRERRRHLPDALAPDRLNPHVPP